MSKTQQLNIRLTTQQQDVIHAAVFVRELRSPQALFDPLLEEMTDRLLTDAEVASAVSLRHRTRSRAAKPSRAKPARS